MSTRDFRNNQFDIDDSDIEESEFNSIRSRKCSKKSRKYQSESDSDSENESENHNNRTPVCRIPGKRGNQKDRAFVPRSVNKQPSSCFSPELNYDEMYPENTPKKDGYNDSVSYNIQKPIQGWVNESKNSAISGKENAVPKQVWNAARKSEDYNSPFNEKSSNSCEEKNEYDEKK